MTAVLVALFCGFLFILMRGSSQVFGKTIGTLIGIAFLGWIVVGVFSLVAVVILPVILPLLVPICIVWLLWCCVKKACS